MSCALDANELGHIFEILAKNELLTSGEHGHGAHAEFKQLRAPGSIVQDIDAAEGDALFRKKLFRSEATASTRLSEQNKLIGANFHIDSAPVEHLPMTSVACKSNPHGKFCAGMNAFRTG